ncbi:MAG TPA: hypothetical protein VGH44_00910 [Candidatus Saccharimonadia bacterium]|jgi:hypothetical protein
MKDNALYLEADEDITSAIDKLKKSTADSVQIVVPKRSTMLQSIINLKLLKKAAESTGKGLVLVTNDRIATDLAARVGLAVAPSLGAKPVIAEVEMPADLKAGEEIIEADDPEPPAAAQPTPPAPVKKPLAAFKRKEVNDEPIPVEPDAAATSEAAPAAVAGLAKKRPKVPNFGKLQRRVLWIGLAAFLVIGYVLGMYLFTSAKVVLYANGTKVDIDTTFTVDPAAKQTDAAKGVLAGQTVTLTKDLSGSFTPTGQKDVGTKAAGTITISNCYDPSSHTFVAGTRFMAPDGSLFRSTADVTVPGGQGSFFGCTTPGTATVAVQADQNGDKYNEAPATYTMPGLPASEQTGQNSILSKGGQMSGGTTKTATVVQQSDVDSAKADLLSKDQDAASRALKGQLPSGYKQLDDSQASSVSDINPAPAVGAEGATANLTLKVTYTVLAVKQSDYQNLVRAQEQSQIGSQNQIYDDGLSAAQLTATGKDSAGRQGFHFTTEAYSGAKLDTKAIAAQLAGKKFGDASDAAKRQPGVSDASILIWPGWATNLPSRAGKIQVTIQVTNKQ